MVLLCNQLEGVEGAAVTAGEYGSRDGGCVRQLHSVAVEGKCRSAKSVAALDQKQGRGELTNENVFLYRMTPRDSMGFYLIVYNSGYVMRLAN